MREDQRLPRSGEERLDGNSPPTAPAGAGGDDALDSNTGVGIGADDEPNTFEPEEDPE